MYYGEINQNLKFQIFIFTFGHIAATLFGDPILAKMCKFDASDKNIWFKSVLKPISKLIIFDKM